MHCVANGHRIVALANLYSQISDENSDCEEVDSFMYQTVGSNKVVPLIAECLDLPLFRRPIRGSSVETSMNYSGIHSGDEVEDLLELLLEVKKNIPDVQAVSVGAILSNYQRIRVENICTRLNLTPLSFLWQSDQSALLQSMIDTGVHAVLVKVAALGLDPFKHLGKSIAQMQPILEQLNDKFGCHVCGEGGEYETVTLDCPLFKKKFVIIDQSTVIHSNDAGAIVAYLKFKTLKIEEKADNGTGELTDEIRERLIAFGSKNYIGVDDVKYLVSESADDTKALREIRRDITVNFSGHELKGFISPSVSFSKGYLAIGGARSRNSMPVDKETRDAMDAIAEILQRHDMAWPDVIMMHLLVASMDDFSAVNAVYGSYFGSNPPTRVTVEVEYHRSDSASIQIDCLAFKNGGTSRPGIESSVTVKKSVMHVQGISYWAPSNIGPYSQTVKLNDHLFVAGQIGLIPNTMTLPQLASSPTDLGQLFAECLVCFNNIEAIACVQGCEFPNDLGVLVCFVRSAAYLKAAQNFCSAKILKFESIPSLFLAVPKLPRACAVEFQTMFQSPNDLPDLNDDDDEDSETIQKMKYLSSSARVFNGNKKIDCKA
ncbi:ATP binding domain 4 [Physocladia obscura]|uniref:Diphthine--ammonia ligase n=1 Tax=Physocladia obscura TaxID=109957 RepID=A0AAD5SSU8_9FUNG|nr:ATP binding domain 4 [Physocladia obscura]